MAVLLATSIDPSKKAQIRALIGKKTPTKVLVDYLDNADVFSLDLAIGFREHTEINNYSINFVKEK